MESHERVQRAYDFLVETATVCADEALKSGLNTHIMLLAEAQMGMIRAAINTVLSEEERNQVNQKIAQRRQ